jgi:hypothetical protein
MLWWSAAGGFDSLHCISAIDGPTFNEMYDWAHFESPAAFAAEFMQHEVQAGGTVVVGSR